MTQITIKPMNVMIIDDEINSIHVTRQRLKDLKYKTTVVGEYTSPVKGFKAIQEKTHEMLKDVLKKIPYDALVLSRQGNLITVNLGKKDGIEKGKVLTVIQIIKEQRHPKFGILIKTDKEILGKIKLLKIDDNLSFGKIIVEKEKGAIQKHSKISGIDLAWIGVAVV